MQYSNIPNRSDDNSLQFINAFFNLKKYQLESFTQSQCNNWMSDISI